MSEENIKELHASLSAYIPKVLAHLMIQEFLAAESGSATRQCLLDTMVKIIG